MQSQLYDCLHIYEFKSFNLSTVRIESESLKHNPLKDPHVRFVPVLRPKVEPPAAGYPLILVLPGFTGNGTQYFSWKFQESNFAQTIDTQAAVGKAPLAVYAFVDAMTYWGGSQFLNSSGTGQYQDYVMQELLPALDSKFPLDPRGLRRCLFGGSSGGYGALHLGSLFPQSFGFVGAISPDSFFESCYLPDLYAAAPLLQKFGGVEGVKAEIDEGSLMRRRDIHPLLNSIGMAFCYSPVKGKKQVEFPIDLETGELRLDIWQLWKSHDPVEFLKHRKDQVRELSRIYLDVGNKDQFHLHFGSRQIRNTLRDLKIPFDYSEFDGNHFDLSLRRAPFLQWLNRQWSTEIKG